MKEFLNRVLNSQDNTSSRRFSALVGLILYASAAIVIMCGVDIDMEILYATGGFVSIMLGLTTISSVLRK
jgi:hypothetical protein